MKGKPITFRPRQDLRQRLEDLAAALDRPYTWLLDKAVEAALPALETKYREELEELRKKGPQRTTYALRPEQLNEVHDRPAATPPAKKKRAA